MPVRRQHEHDIDTIGLRHHGIDWGFVSKFARPYCVVCHRFTSAIGNRPGTLDLPVHVFHGEFHMVVANEQMYRQVMDLDYYDLIELPSGGHIPVPMARTIAGINALCRIPLDRTKFRGTDFYYCDACARMHHMDEDTLSAWGRSMFRCKIHRPLTASEHWNKAHELSGLVVARKWKKLKYVRHGPRIFTEEHEHQDMRAYNGKNGHAKSY